METLGRYQILGEIGRGGCGIVYAATDPRIGRKVAIKTIHAGAEDGHSYRERLRREAHSAGVLSHANIVTIHEFDEVGEMTYIVMEYVEGQTLAQKMKGQPLSVEFITSFIRQAADALDFAHSQNIVHRDVKPGNFLITDKGTVKVADFGIAKAIGAESDLTKTGTVVGTVHYMSPEQVASRQVTGQSDLFSLAVIAYEMITGKKPFQGDSWASILHQIVTADPPPVKLYRANLGDSVTTVLRKGMAKDPAERYATCKEFAEEFNRAILATTAERTSPGMFADAVKGPLPPPRNVMPDAQTETQAIDQVTATDVPSRRTPWKPLLITAAAALAVVAVVVYGGWLTFLQPTTSNPTTQTPVPESKAPEPAAAAAPPPVEIPKVVEPPASAPSKPEPKAEKAPPKERLVASKKKETVAVIPAPAPPTVAPAATPAPEPAPVEFTTPAPPPGKYRGPPEGRFTWNGTLAPNARVIVGGNRASSGSVGGRGLPPGLAVTVQAEPTSIQVLQQPGASNNFQLVLRNSGASDVTAVNIIWRENKD